MGCIIFRGGEQFPVIHDVTKGMLILRHWYCFGCTRAFVHYVTKQGIIHVCFLMSKNDRINFPRPGPKEEAQTGAHIRCDIRGVAHGITMTDAAVPEQDENKTRFNL